MSTSPGGRAVLVAAVRAVVIIFLAQPVPVAQLIRAAAVAAQRLDPKTEQHAQAVQAVLG
jgi:hypothetical protein